MVIAVCAGYRCGEREGAGGQAQERDKNGENERTDVLKERG